MTTKIIRPWDDNYKSTISQDWDKNKITIKRNGKNINLYDYIQENEGDTDIKKCLEKYGTLQPITINQQGIYADIEKAFTLEDSMKLDLELRNIFDNLPKEEREIFHNNIYEFKDNGLKYYENQIKEKLNEQTTQQNNTTTTQGNNDETNNKQGE